MKRRRVSIKYGVVLKEILTPREFIKLYNSRKGLIKSSSILPVKLGHKDFGKIKVNYSTHPFNVTFDQNLNINERAKYSSK